MPKRQKTRSSARTQRGRRSRGITYTGQKSTHDTDGLPGYPAVDIFARPGTPFTAPESGRIVRRSGKGGTKGDVYGFSIYFVGDSGRTYFITHLTGTAAIGVYQRGDVLGKVSPWSGGSPHAHVGISGDGPPLSAVPDAPQEQPQAPTALQQSVPPNAPPMLSPPLPGLPGDSQVALPKDLAEAWRMIANQPLSSPESQRWAGLFGGDEAA